VISVTRNAPQLQVKQPCDLEALKQRYIEQITAAKQGSSPSGDMRLDFQDVAQTIAALEGRSPSLWLVTGILGASAVCAGIGIALLACLHVGSTATVISELVLTSLLGWTLATLVLDLVWVLAVAGVRWHLAQCCLERRVDQRWHKVAQKRADKAEAMRMAASRAGDCKSSFEDQAKAVVPAPSLEEPPNDGVDDF